MTLICCYCGVVGLLLGTYLVAQRLSEGARLQENGSDIPPQIVTRAETISRQLNPNSGEVEVTERGQGDTASGSMRARWSVVCTVPDRSLNFVFSKATGALLLCSQMARATESGDVGIREAKTAEQTGRRYLRLLELEGEGDHWATSDPPKQRANSWLVRFHRGKRHLYMILDSWTGDLLLLSRD